MCWRKKNGIGKMLCCGKENNSVTILCKNLPQFFTVCNKDRHTTVYCLAPSACPQEGWWLRAIARASQKLGEKFFSSESWVWKHSTEPFPSPIILCCFRQYSLNAGIAIKGNILMKRYGTQISIIYLKAKDNIYVHQHYYNEHEVK